MSGAQSAEPDNTSENDLIIEKSDEDYAETDVSRHGLFLCRKLRGRRGWTGFLKKARNTALFTKFF